MMDSSRDLEGILGELVAIPSVTGSEEALCVALYKALTTQGLVPEYHANGNLLVALEGGASDPRGALLLAGHLDTVPPASPEQLCPQVTLQQGQLWLHGRGSVDMKAGLAAMVRLAREVTEGIVRLPVPVKLLFYSGEEGPLPNGLTEVLDSGVLGQIQGAIVPEPTSCDVAMGCLGTLSAEICVPGVSAHSAWPWKGTNALYKALPIIRAVEGWGVRDGQCHGIPFRETMSVTRIHTENPHNVIPDACEFTVNYRFPPDMSNEKAREALTHCLAGPMGDQGASLTRVDISPSCFLSPRSSHPLVKRCSRVFGWGTSSSRSRPVIFQAWSDIAQLSARGIPALNFGPGELARAHQADEAIRVGELEEYYDLLVQWLTWKG